MFTISGLEDVNTVTLPGEKEKAGTANFTFIAGWQALVLDLFALLKYPLTMYIFLEILRAANLLSSCEQWHLKD